MNKCQKSIHFKPLKLYEINVSDYFIQINLGFVDCSGLYAENYQEKIYIYTVYVVHFKKQLILPLAQVNKESTNYNRKITKQYRNTRRNMCKHLRNSSYECMRLICDSVGLVQC